MQQFSVILFLFFSLISSYSMADVASYQGASSDPSIIVEKKLNSNSSSKSSAKLKKIYVGAKINSISQLDVLSKTVYLDLYLWFRGDSKLTMSEIELNNSIESLDWRKPLKSYSHKQQHYQLFLYVLAPLRLELILNFIVRLFQETERVHTILQLRI